MRTRHIPASFRALRVLSAAVAVTFLVAACDSSSTSPDPDPVAAEVELNTTTVVLTEIGETYELEATVLDTEGNEMSDVSVTWTSSDEEVVTVSESGVVEAVGAGSATVSASTGDLSAAAAVSVEIDDDDDDEEG